MEGIYREILRILAIALGGGVPIVRALEITADTCGNKILEKTINNIKKDITSGSDIAKGLAKHGNFPKLLARMVSVGESSAMSRIYSITYRIYTKMRWTRR